MADTASLRNSTHLGEPWAFIYMDGSVRDGVRVCVYAHACVCVGKKCIADARSYSNTITISGANRIHAISRALIRHDESVLGVYHEPLPPPPHSEQCIANARHTLFTPSLRASSCTAMNIDSA
jgi:hypothetical protein